MLQCDLLRRRCCVCFAVPCSLLDQSITRHYLSNLKDQAGKITAEYVWIGGSMQDVRSKSRTLTSIPKGPEVRMCAGLARGCWVSLGLTGAPAKQHQTTYAALRPLPCGRHMLASSTVPPNVGLPGRPRRQRVLPSPCCALPLEDNQHS